MEIKETVQKLLQEMIVPDLARIKEENGKILVLLDLTNKRLDDVNTHLVDQSRRIDELRAELNQRINKAHSDMVGRIDANNARIDLFFKDSASRSGQKQLEERMAKLEHEVAAMKQQIAA